MQEGNAFASGAQPRRLVDQAHPLGSKLPQSRFDIFHLQGNVLNTFPYADRLALT